MSGIAISIRQSILKLFYISSPNFNSFTHIQPSGYQIKGRVVDGILYCPIGMYQEVLATMEPGVGYADIVADMPVLQKTACSTTLQVLNHALRNRGRACTGILGKGCNYIAAYGMIMTEDHKPIFAFMKKRTTHEGERNVFMVSPRVYSSTDHISKYTVKTLIPNILQFLNFYNANNNEIVISDIIDSFVHKVECPVGEEFNERINHILANKRNDIVQPDESQGILQGLDQSDTL